MSQPNQPPREDDRELRDLLRVAEFQGSTIDPNGPGLDMELRLHLKHLGESGEIERFAPNWTPVWREIRTPGFIEEFKARINNTIASGTYEHLLDQLQKKFTRIVARTPCPHELEELKIFARYHLESQATISSIQKLLGTNPRNN